MKSEAFCCIPIVGMGDGLHQYSFELDDAFIEHMDADLKPGVDVHVEVIADRRASIIELKLKFKGKVASNCDRCTADIFLPIDASYDQLVKLVETEIEVDDEVLFIHPKTASLDLDHILYDFLYLSIPIIKRYDCEDDVPKPCNQKVLDILDQSSSEAQAEHETQDIWKTLKEKLK